MQRLLSRANLLKIRLLHTENAQRYAGQASNKYHVHHLPQPTSPALRMSTVGCMYFDVFPELSASQDHAQPDTVLQVSVSMTGIVLRS